METSSPRTLKIMPRNLMEIVCTFMNPGSGREQMERGRRGRMGDPKIARRVLTCRKERRGKDNYDVRRNRQEELGTGRVADRKWRNQVQAGTEMEQTGNGTDKKEVDRKWMWNSGQEESEQEIDG